MDFYKILRLFFCLSVLFCPNDAILANGQIKLSLTVISFDVDGKGNAVGMLEDGTVFRQYTIFVDDDVRIQRFETNNYYHYVVNDDIIFALEELSKFLGMRQNDKGVAL